MLISAAGLILAVYWEFKEKDPVVDLSLLKNRNFGISAFLMFMVGVVLLGSTVLIPQYLQLVMGYSATLAGLAISPGALLVMFLLPLVGFLLSKVESRWLIGVGLLITCVSLIHMTTFDIQMDFKYAVIARCFQASGLAFLFVPINTAAYAFVPPTKNNAASGLINLARNVGGSLGISIVTTLLDRRMQFHQTRLVEHTTALNPVFNQAIHSASRMVGPAGNVSYALILHRLQQQATTLSYIDCFWAMGIIFGLLIPLVFLMKKTKPGRPAMAH
jgi:DHA2 family multidrug resistance protein